VTAGRPEIGPRIQVRVDRDLLDRIDTLVMRTGPNVTRAEVMRGLLDLALTRLEELQ
jgi:Arc/MetJ-type ribon-helix-helix transcriptional regulator